MTKMFIGDGIYAEAKADDTIILTTENGIKVTNTIVLEPEVWDSLLAFVKRFVKD